MMKGFLEGFLFRPQGGPMAYPSTVAAKVSQFPYRHVWHECWHIRFITYSMALVMIPMYWKLNKKLTGPENKKLWAEKRKHDLEHFRHEREKAWEVRT